MYLFTPHCLIPHLGGPPTRGPPKCQCPPLVSGNELSPPVLLPSPHRGAQLTKRPVPSAASPGHRPSVRSAHRDQCHNFQLQSKTKGDLTRSASTHTEREHLARNANSDPPRPTPRSYLCSEGPPFPDRIPGSPQVPRSEARHNGGCRSQGQSSDPSIDPLRRARKGEKAGSTLATESQGSRDSRRRSHPDPRRPL